MTIDQAYILLAAQATRGARPCDAYAYLAWPEYAAVDAVCSFLRWMDL